jgi:hypothetical protein
MTATPRTGNGPDHAVIEIPIPMQAGILRARRQKPERVALVVRRPVAFPVLTGDRAPVVAAYRAPAARPAIYSPPLSHAVGLAWIRFDGKRYWRPLAAFRTGHPVCISDLDAHIAGWASEGIEWADWPYAIQRRGLGHGKATLVEERGLALQSCTVDPDAEHADLARGLVSDLCLIDGHLHRACRQPTVDVIVQGLSENRISRVLVSPSAGAQPSADMEKDVVQTYRGDAADEAESQAARIAAMLGVRAWIGPRWEITSDCLTRVDALDGPAEGLARIVARTHALVGRLPRPVAEAWLDARDAARVDRDPEGALGCLARLTDRVGPGGSLVPILLRIEGMRWGAPDAEIAEDVMSLGALA